MRGACGGGRSEGMCGVGRCGEHSLCLMSLMIMVSRLAISLCGGCEGGGRITFSYFKVVNRESPYQVLLSLAG